MDLSHLSLSIDEFAGYYNEGIPIVDTRSIQELTNGYVRYSLAIPEGKNLQAWLQTFIGNNQPFLLVDDYDNIESTYKELSQEYQQHVKGFLRVGVEGWMKAERPMDILISVDTEELILDFKHDEYIRLIDVRSNEQFKSGHLKNAVNIPVNNLPDHLQNLSTEDKLYIYSQNGEESAIAVTYLKKNGFHFTRNIAPGFANLQETEIPVVK